MFVFSEWREGEDLDFFINLVLCTYFSRTLNRIKIDAFIIITFFIYFMHNTKVLF